MRFRDETENRDAASFFPIDADRPGAECGRIPMEVVGHTIVVEVPGLTRYQYDGATVTIDGRRYRVAGPRPSWGIVSF